MSNHTPGLWKYFKNTDGTFSVFPTGNGYFDNEGKGYAATILAEVFTDGIDDPEANARIISASPEMYDALKMILEALIATGLFMATSGLETDKINELVDYVSELLAKIDNEQETQE